MLDHYIYTIPQERDNPEKPGKLITRVVGERLHIGGAGNVAANLANLGASVQLVYLAAGDDWQIMIENQLARYPGITPVPFTDTTTPATIRKQRTFTNGEYDRRDDFEGEAFDQPTEETQEGILRQIVDSVQGTDAILLSDYSKGMFLDERLPQEIIEYAKSSEILVFVDPKPRNARNFRRATLVRPNLKEAQEITGYEFDRKSATEKDYETVTEKLQKVLEVRYAAVTLGGEGVITLDGDFRHIRSTSRPEDVKDVIGAGDIFMSALTLGMTSGLSLEEAAYLANLASGISVRRKGPGGVSLKDLEKELLISNGLHDPF